jgi:type I restriction enzyme S subunit
LQYLKIPVPPLDVQQTIIDEMDRRRSEAKRLRSQAEAVVVAAKARVERMILGEETVE